MKNEKGVTLIELLATITILFIFSSIIWGVFTSTNKSYHSISNKESLEQEANIILATIKNYHLKQSLQDTSKTYVIQYNPSTQKGFIGKNSSNLTPLQSNNINIIININGSVPATNNPITINPSSPLYFDITVMNQQGQSYEVSTIIKQY